MSKVIFVLFTTTHNLFRTLMYLKSSFFFHEQILFVLKDKFHLFDINNCFLLLFYPSKFNEINFISKSKILLKLPG